MLKIIDLFAGAGGLSNGFEQTGNFEVVGAVEINKAAIKTYKHNHQGEDLIITPENDTVSDISRIKFHDFLVEKNLNERRNELIVIGGPPCQGFSNANRQKNYLISGNNQLVKEYVRAIDEIRPAAFLMENVKTINSEAHKFFVTNETNEEGIAQYSTLSHLESIVEEDESLVSSDQILIIETSEHTLRPIFDEICSKFDNVNLLFNPIVTDKNDLSRLRSLIKKISTSMKSNNIFALETNKFKDTLKLKNSIEHYIVSEQLESRVVFEDVCGEAIESLNILMTVENIDVAQRVRILNSLKLFADLNKFLRFLEELRVGNIFLEGNPSIHEVTDGKIEVIANVLSYNVVEYLKKVFSSMGYEIKDEVINSVNYLVPQKRERFMVLGVKREFLDGQKIEFPAPLINESILASTVHDAISDLENVVPETEIKPNGNLRLLNRNENGTTRLLNYYRSGIKEHNVIYNHVNTESRETSIERFEVLDKMSTGARNFHSLPDELKNNTYANAARTQNTVYLKLQYDIPSPTVINVRKSMWQHPTEPRAVSIREAARLQSFKDDFIFLGSKDQQYQQIGNAVPPLMARAVAEKVLGYLGIQVINPLDEELLNVSSIL